MRLSRIRAKVIRTLAHINISRHIANHLVGETHTRNHHRGVGVVIMVLGVTSVKLLGGLYHSLVYEVGVEVVGFTFHALGAIPWIGDFEKKAHEIINPNLKVVRHEESDSRESA